MRPSEENERRVEFRVGIFVLMALFIGGSLAFVIGNQKSVFRSKVEYVATFDSVSGLRPGSSIRIAGVDVGTVREVKLGEDGKIHVSLGIVEDAAQLVREDSVASIGNKGLLGDKLVDITVGSDAVLPPGGRIRTEAPSEISEYLSKAGGILQSVEATVQNLEQATEPLAREEFSRDLQSITEHLAEITRMVAEEDGTARRLLSDPETADQFLKTLKGTEAATREFARTAESARLILDEIRSGDGSAHELIYGDGGTRLMDNTADAVGELAAMLQEVRTGDGMAHDLIYEREGQQIIDNLEATTADLALVARNVREGRGTIGAFLTDPSVYEDIKRLVGDLERNDILRALVRYSIRADSSGSEVAVEPVSE